MSTTDLSIPEFLLRHDPRVSLTEHLRSQPPTPAKIGGVGSDGWVVCWHEPPALRAGERRRPFDMCKGDTWEEYDARVAAREAALEARRAQRAQAAAEARRERPPAPKNGGLVTLRSICDDMTAARKARGLGRVSRSKVAIPALTKAAEMVPGWRFKPDAVPRIRRIIEEAIGDDQIASRGSGQQPTKYTRTKRSKR